MTIGELAKAAKVSVQTLRFYEREGLLGPVHRRTDSGYREFDEDALARLTFIRRAQQAGFALCDVRELIELQVLPLEACADVRIKVNAKLAEVEARMQELLRVRTELRRLERACARAETRSDCPCPVLDELGRPKPSV
ncbi:MAG: heavy metal-responsive transcriptional regulator [Candidatus Didemnitutus sp.]|nr:heavy metal-responsive transcriptional regulator [Candidatus Didemnitutus sp.]